MNNGLAHGCGQCLPCLINRRRLWTHRIMLERSCFEDNAFVTLTYAPEYCPPDGSLVPGHVRDFIKRLRRKIEPLKIRYYLVGEYGDKSERPHYHIALFGFPSCRHGRPIIYGRRGCRCLPCTTIAGLWNYGLTYNGSLESDSAAYVAQYVTKALTKKNDERLNGRHPEFARMSNRPGIGANAIKNISKFLMTEFGQMHLIERRDVPDVLSINGKQYPLGRYLKGKIRESIGKEKGTPPEVLRDLKKQFEEKILEYWEKNEKPFGNSKTFSVEMTKQEALKQSKKLKIHSKGKKL